MLIYLLLMIMSRWYLQIVEKLKKNLVMFFRKKKSKLGLNTAHIFGYEFALKHQYKNLITMDADLSHDPDEIQIL